MKWRRTVRQFQTRIKLRRYGGGLHHHPHNCLNHQLNNGRLLLQHKHVRSPPLNSIPKNRTMLNRLKNYLPQKGLYFVMHKRTRSLNGLFSKILTPLASHHYFLEPKPSRTSEIMKSIKVVSAHLITQSQEKSTVWLMLSKETNKIYQVNRFNLVKFQVVSCWVKEDARIDQKTNDCISLSNCYLCLWDFLCSFA